MEWKMMALASTLALAGCGGAGGAGSAGAGSGAPSEGTVRDLIVRKYEPNGNTAASHVDVAQVQIGAGFAANAGQASDWECDLNETVYPVRVKYTLVNGSGPSAYIRDYDQHYVAFISRVKMGQWDLSGAAVAGDVNGELRGAGPGG